jgi:hypothetical protein
VAASDRGRRVEVDVVPLDGVASGSVTEALERLPARGERSLEALPNGNVLMKSVEAVRGPGGALAAYTWRLGRATARGGLQMAEFRLCLPVETAAEVIAQADLATLDREVREAAFADGTDAPSAA